MGFSFHGVHNRTYVCTCQSYTSSQNHQTPLCTRMVHIVCRYQLGWNFSYAREQVLSTRLFCTSIFINSPVFFTWFLVMNFCRVYFWFSGLEFWFFIFISNKVVSDFRSHLASLIYKHIYYILGLYANSINDLSLVVWSSLSFSTFPLLSSFSSQAALPTAGSVMC